MKRYIVLLSMALMAVSCQRGDYMNEPDIVGGRNVVNSQEARKYMMYIADNLVTDVLDELELGLSISGRGVQQSAHFTIDKPLTTPGATWQVKAEDSQMKGMTLHCTAEDTWELEFEGDYVFGEENYVTEENDYPTKLSMKAVKYVPTGADDPAVGWEVSFSGERKEWNDNKKLKSYVPKSTYSCTFGTSSAATMRYLNTRGKGASGWNQVFGDLFMTVYKAGEQVDMCCLSFEGSPSQATYIRGL